MTTYNVTKNKIGKEDVEFGTSTFVRTLSDGSTAVLHQIAAEDVPIKDNGNLINPSSDDVETALQTIQVSLDVEEAVNSIHRSATAPHSGHVDTTGDETISGVKSFASFPLTPSSPPVSDYQIANKKYVDDAVDPIGCIVMFGAADAPAGWLMCNGTAVSRTTYTNLFAVISTTFGIGDGSTTFNLPDLQQRFPLGKAAAGTGSTLGGTGGAIDHTHTGPSHTHVLVNSATVIGSAAVTGGNTIDGGLIKNISVDVGADIPVASATPTAGGTGATGTGNPPFQAVNFIIKY